MQVPGPSSVCRIWGLQGLGFRGLRDFGFQGLRLREFRDLGFTALGVYRVHRL